MKKILVCVDGTAAKVFLERINNTYPNDNVYDIVYYHDSVLPENPAIYCRYYKLDPTSPKKLATVLTRKHIQAMIFMDEKLDAQAAYENIRALNKEIPILFLDYWNSHFEDENVTIIDANELVANRVLAQLPDIPVVAQHVGLGIGEITEVSVPFGSSYAYRHVSNVEQKNWKVAAIYRNNELVLPRPSTMIRPNDSLLLVGQPPILKHVYKAIKSELGQFPAPYGKNIFHLIDMDYAESEEEVIEEIRRAIDLHKKLKNKILFIKVVNPDSYRVIEFARHNEMMDVNINIAYNTYDIRTDFKEDIKKCNAGLVMVGRHLFAERKIRKVMHEVKRPILKLGIKPLSQVRNAADLFGDV